LCYFHMTLSVSRRCYFFFFSSRRRHTISKRDWSSDVCSSDLPCPRRGRRPRPPHHPHVQVEADPGDVTGLLPAQQVAGTTDLQRSEERRVGKECRYQRSPHHYETRTERVVVQHYG